MKALREPLEELRERVSYFVGAAELRLMAVLVDERLREPALGVIAAMEDHADNRSAFFRLDEPFAKNAAGWQERAGRLRADYEARVQSREPDSGRKPSDLPPATGAEDDLTVFGQHLLDAGRVVADRYERQGLTLVLAPTEIQDVTRAARDIRQLVTSPSLQSVRWIVVTADESLAESLAATIGAHGVLIRCDVDEARLRADMAELLARSAGKASGVHGSVWPSGRTPPDRIGQRRRKRKPASVPAEVKDLLETARIHTDAAGRIRDAAAAMAAGAPAKAVRLQTLARDTYATAGMLAESSRMELILGTYQTRLDDSVGGGVPAALKTFGRALSLAEAGGFAREAAQAALGQAQLQLMAGAREEAFRMFVRAAEHAEKADSPVLAIESLRAAGQVALETGAERAAASLWKGAVGVASRTGADEVRASSAAECARLLGRLCRRYDRLGSMASDCDRAADQLAEMGVLEEPVKQRLGLDAPLPGELPEAV